MDQKIDVPEFIISEIMSIKEGGDATSAWDILCELTTFNDGERAHDWIMQDVRAHTLAIVHAILEISAQ